MPTIEGYTKADVADAEGYLWVDLETSGLDPRRNQIVQFASIVTDLELRIKAHWMTYVRPEPDYVIEQKALDCNHLTIEKLEKIGAPEVCVATAFAGFMLLHRKLIFAGFKAPFDLGFVDALCEKYDISKLYMIPWYDTYEHARRKLKKTTPNHKLVTVANHFGFKTTGAHDALFDIHTTIKVERKLRQIA